MSKAIIHTDGGSRGNPGPAGIGYTIDVDGLTVSHGGHYIGHTTNNVAEYMALIWALENALAMGLSDVEVQADSELLVKQVLGIYRVKNEGLKPLHAQVKEFSRQFSTFGIKHVRREFNKSADALANTAMDNRETHGDYAVELGGSSQQPLF